MSKRIPKKPKGWTPKKETITFVSPKEKKGK